MKTYTDLMTSEEEVEGEYREETPYSENAAEASAMQQPNAPEASTQTFSIGKEYLAKLENSLSKLETAMSIALESDIRFKAEQTSTGTKIVSVDLSSAVKTKIFNSLRIESNEVSDFEKEKNTGHSITKFYFKAIITAVDGSEVEFNIPSNEYWFDYDLDDWMVIKK